MKRIASMLIGALFVGASCGIAMAQGSAAPVNPPATLPGAGTAVEVAPPAANEHADEVAAFHRTLKMHHRMWRRLKQNPDVVKDDAWVGKYPDLQLFFSKYHGSRKRFLADPGLYLKMPETKAMDREKTRGAGAE
jgi:hypothetical protein